MRAFFKLFYLSFMLRTLTSLIFVLIFGFIYMLFNECSFEAFTRGFDLFLPIALLRIFGFPVYELYVVRSFYIRPFFITKELEKLKKESKSDFDFKNNEYYKMLESKGDEFCSIFLEDFCFLEFLAENKKISEEEFLSISSYINLRKGKDSNVEEVFLTKDISIQAVEIDENNMFEFECKIKFFSNC